jgi:hypothetical protein
MDPNEINVNELGVPQHIQDDAVFAGWSAEEQEEMARNYYLENPPVGSSQSNETSEEVQSLSNAPINETPTSEPQTPSSFEFSKFGLSSEDELKQRLDRLNEYEQKIEDINKSYEVLSRAKNPFADESIAKINRVYEVTGIKDMGFATKLLEATSDSLMENPIQALAMSAMIEKESYAKQGYDFIYRQIARENGVDPHTNYEDLDDDSKEMLRFKSIDAIEKIAEKQKEFNNNSDFFASLQNQYQESSKQQQEILSQWSEVRPTVVKSIAEGLKSEYKHPELGTFELSVAIGEDRANELFQMFESSLSQLSPDKTGIERIKSAALQQAMTIENVHKILDSVLPQMADKMRGQITEEVIRKNHNGGPTNIDRKDAPPAGKTFTWDDAFKSTKF